MSYLNPQQAVPGVAQDMAAVALLSQTFVKNPVGFRIDIWALNMDNNSERPTLRLIDGGGLHTTGYAWEKWDKQNGAAYSQEAQSGNGSDTWFDNQGPANIGLVTGFWEGRLMVPSTNLWSIRGWFRDDASVEQVQLDFFGQVALDSPCTGSRVASGNASTWSAGTLYHQSW